MNTLLWCFSPQRLLFQAHKYKAIVTRQQQQICTRTRREKNFAKWKLFFGLWGNILEIVEERASTRKKERKNFREIAHIAEENEKFYDFVKTCLIFVVGFLA